MILKCTCGSDKGFCVECVEEFIISSTDLHREVKAFCDYVLNHSNPDIKSIEGLAHSIAHHPLILNCKD